jgi:hypothetical protein
MTFLIVKDHQMIKTGLGYDQNSTSTTQKTDKNQSVMQMLLEAP